LAGLTRLPQAINNAEDLRRFLRIAKGPATKPRLEAQCGMSSGAHF
jgi:hypothetical protein